MNRRAFLQVGAALAGVVLVPPLVDRSGNGPAMVRPAVTLSPTRVTGTSIAHQVVWNAPVSRVYHAAQTWGDAPMRLRHVSRGAGFIEQRDDVVGYAWCEDGLAYLPEGVSGDLS